MDNFKVILEAMIDQSSLTNIQKKIAKDRLKISADINVEDFAKSKQAIEKQIQALGQGIKAILGDAVSDKQASQWAKQYYDQMISGAKKAASEQAKADKERLANIEKIRKASQQSQSQKEAEKQNQIKGILDKQIAAYKEIQNINKQIAGLDPQKDSQQIAALESKKKIQQEIFIATQKSLGVNKSQENNEIRLKAFAEERRKIESEIAVIKGKQADTRTQSNANSSLKESQKTYNDLLKTAQQLNSLQNKQVKLDPKSNPQEWSTLSKQIDEVAIKYDKLWSEFWGKPQNLEIFKMEDLNRLKELGYTLEQTKSKIQDLQKTNVKEINLMANGGVKNDYATQIAKLQGNFRSLGLTETEVASHTQKVLSALQTLQNELKEPFSQQSFEAIKTANDAVQRELAETTNEYTRLQASAKGLATEQQRLTLANTIEAWNQKNTAATKAVLDQNNKYIASLRELDVTMDRMSFDAIKNGFKKAENSMRGLGKLGASFRNQMKQAAQSFTTWLSASTLVMTFISKTREAVTTLKDVNTLLTEISKANDKLTKSQLKGIGDRSFETASQFGKKATDYLAGVQEMSRAGYQDAEAMGALSVKAQGAGAMTADVANSFIVATDKAYKLNGSLTDLTEVMDGINYITNHNAVNMTELSEGFSIVASTAASFGVDANELSAALGTMAASTQQSGSEVARAFRAILLNIRQVSDEEEGIDAEGLTKYENACNALNVKLKETKNGVQELRDPMEVLRELSVEYNKLSDTDIRKVNLLNSVGGKLRATQLDALLRGWSDYETMLGQFADGAGSMAKEAEKTANSWEGSMNRLSNTWTDTIGNIANSDGVIGLIKSLDWVLDKINKLTGALGSLGSIGLIGGLVAGIKNVGGLKFRESLF